jgi:two-component system CheB/CheR fusion protein
LIRQLLHPLDGALDRTGRIYQSTTQPGERPRLMPRLLGMREPPQHLLRPVGPSGALTEATGHRCALDRVAPPSVLVDETHR